MRQGVFFGEAMPLAEEHTVRYPAFLEKREKKQRWIIKKVAYAAQSLASKHTLRALPTPVPLHAFPVPE